MIKVDFNESWKYTVGRIPDNDFELPFLTDKLDLPYDFTACGVMDEFAPYGELNGYTGQQIAALYKELPPLKKYTEAYLELDGVAGICELYINDRRIDTFCSDAKRLIRIDGFLADEGNFVKLVLTTGLPGGTYKGLGISGSVRLILIENAVHITPCGISVTTLKVGDKAELNIKAEIANKTTEAKQLEILAEIYNAKQKRVTKKLRKIKLGANSKKIFELPLKMGSFYEWSKYDPYKYGIKVSVKDPLKDGKVLEFAEDSFGIRTAEISGRFLKINGKNEKLRGTVLSRESGFLGNIGTYSLAAKKLETVKELGFNAVRYKRCPTEAELTALDDSGLYAVVDLFSVLEEGALPGDGHMLFAPGYKKTVENTVKALRNHPSVIIYNVCDNAAESYGRGRGTELVSEIVSFLKSQDPTRIVTGNAFERVPTARELQSMGVKLPKTAADKSELLKKAISAAREKNQFLNATDEYYSLFDAAGYSFLYPRYSTDKVIPGRVILGLEGRNDKLFEAFDEAEKCPSVIGEFSGPCFDCVGKPSDFDDDREDLVKRRINTDGLVDLTGRLKEKGYYAKILLGAKNFSYIVVEDPETGSDDIEAEDVHLWNWPKHIGKSIKVKVYTGGDIVALFLDGKPIGRKLAGKFNRHIAEFNTHFFPGKLEAVSYHKGIEQSRAVLETVQAPKMLKIECTNKSVTVGDITYLYVSITDKEGRVVPYAVRDITVSVSGEGEFVAAGNGDPKNPFGSNELTVPVYDGYACVALKGTLEGKILVKVVSEGLIGNKATIKVKAIKK